MRTRLRASLDADLDIAVRAFNGTATDRRIWAKIAWRVGAQAVIWFNEAADKAKVVPNLGLEGTFDWLHQTAEVYVPKSLSCEFKPEVDLRVF